MAHRELKTTSSCTVILLSGKGSPFLEHQLNLATYPEKVLVSIVIQPVMNHHVPGPVIVRV